MLDSLNAVAGSLDEDILLTVDDVMTILKCSRTALWRYMRYHQLPYIRLGNKKSHVLFRREALRQWIKAQEIVETSNVVPLATN